MTSCREWTKTLYKASFKGVGFEVDNDTVTVGRRVITHEYPSREYWDNEDLGKAKETVEVTGYVYGDSSDAQADRLLRACNSLGAGTLILPTRTNMRARCLKADRGFVADKLGRIDVRMSFVLESGGVGGLVSLSFLLGAVVGAVATAIATLTQRFSIEYQARNVPNVARDAATATVVKAARELSIFTSRLQLDAEAAPDVKHALMTLQRDAAVLAYGGAGQDVLSTTTFVSTVLGTNTDLGIALTNVVESIADATADKQELASVFDALSGFSRQVIPYVANCRSVDAEYDLTDRVARHVRLLCLLKWAEARVLGTFHTRQDAVNARAEISARISAEIDVSVSVDEMNALRSVHDAVVEYITKNGAERPVSRIATTIAPVPILAVAEELYGDVSQADNIVLNNGIRNPLASPLEFEVMI